MHFYRKRRIIPRFGSLVTFHKIGIYSRPAVVMELCTFISIDIRLSVVLKTSKENWEGGEDNDNGFRFGQEEGVAGTLTCLNKRKVADQPIVSLDWCKTKMGLVVLTALDQTMKIIIVTKLDRF
jgi:hypothetical protein